MLGCGPLAVQFGAGPQDVYALAKENELRKLFIRTDGQPVRPVRSGREALVQIMGMKDAKPYKPTLTGAEAKKVLTQMRYPRETLSGPEARAELTRLRYGPYQSAAEAGLPLVNGR